MKAFAVQRRRIRYYGQYCQQHAESFWREYNSETFVGPNTCFRSSIVESVEYDIELIVIDYRPNFPCWISLRECGGKRRFDLKTGVFEAAALQRKLERTSPDRPLTHDLIISVARAYGGHFETLVIGDSKDSAYTPGLLRLSNSSATIDCRPSDGIILAVKSDFPIRLAGTAL